MASETNENGFGNGLWGNVTKLGIAGLAIGMVGVGGWRLLDMQETLNTHLMANGDKLSESLSKQVANQDKMIDLLEANGDSLDSLDKHIRGYYTTQQ